MLHLIYRLVVQPNISRAQTFADAFISSGGIETLLVLLQREAKSGDHDVPEFINQHDTAPSTIKDVDMSKGASEYAPHGGESLEGTELGLHENASEHANIGDRAVTNMERTSSLSENPFLKNLGGISFSISAENARNNVYNVDKSDGIVVGIINLLGALVMSGHLKLDAPDPPDVTSNLLGLLDGGGSMFDDKLSLLLFGLQKAFQAVPNRLLTCRVYTALLAASVNNFSLNSFFFRLLKLLPSLFVADGI